MTPGAVVTAPVPGSAASADMAFAVLSDTATTSPAATQPPTPGRSGHVHTGDDTAPSALTRTSRSSSGVRSVTHTATPGSTQTPPAVPMPDSTTCGRGCAGVGAGDSAVTFS